MLYRKRLHYFSVILTILLFSCSGNKVRDGIPCASQQLILVLTDSIKSSDGLLYYYERESGNSNWKQLSPKIPVVIGRNGLGLGIGLHRPLTVQNFPVKGEGDGRSPAGIFHLSKVFGYKSIDQMTGLKMPYLHITELTECIDDARSKYYNQIVSKDTLKEPRRVDWQSSEKMKQAGIYYELGIVVDHNVEPVRAGAGSCIFLHNWAEPNETMAGCTGMAPENMEKIVYWLNIDKYPVLVQLTRQLYFDFAESWTLPYTTD